MVRGWTCLGICLLVCLFVSVPVHGMGRHVEGGRLELRIAELTNEARERQGLPPLRLDGALTTAARQHSNEMLRLGYFDHDSPTPAMRTLRQRAVRAGVSPHWLGENIAYYDGYDVDQVARTVVDDWMRSPGHRANILRASFHAVGVGLASDGRETYVTQDFSGESTGRVAAPRAPEPDHDDGHWIHVGPWKFRVRTGGY